MKSIVCVAIVISTFLAFALITTEKVPATFVNVLAQSESWDINETPGGSSLGNDTGTTGWRDLDENATEIPSQEDKGVDGLR